MTAPTPAELAAERRRIAEHQKRNGFTAIAERNLVVADALDALAAELAAAKAAAPRTLTPDEIRHLPEGAVVLLVTPGTVAAARVVPGPSRKRLVIVLTGSGEGRDYTNRTATAEAASAGHVAVVLVCMPVPGEQS